MSELANLIRPVGAYLAVAVTLSLLYLGGAMEFLELRLFDLRFGLAKRDAGGDIVLVAIDNASLKELGVWPWPRTVHARALDNIAGAGAGTIAYNVDFSSASLAAADLRFQEALARAGRKTILPAFLQTERHGNGGHSVAYTGPLPAFAQHATIASVNLFPSADGHIREFLGEINWRAGTIPSLATVMAGREKRIPDRFYIDYGIDGDSFPRVSFADILHGRFNREDLSGKIVIVGATAAELAGGFPTTQGPAVPGSVLHALAAESLLQDRTLWRAPVFSGLVGIFLPIFVFAPFCGRRSWQQGLVATGAAISVLFFIGLGVQAFLPVLIDIVPWTVGLLAGFGLGMTRLLNTLNLRLVTQNRTIGRWDAYVRGLVETAFDGVVAVDEDGMIRSANQRAQEMFGRDENELTGLRFSELLSVDGQPDPSAFLLAAAQRETAAEVTALRGGKEEFVAKMAVTRVPGEDARALFVVLLLDVTAQRKAEADAMDIRQRLTDSLESISESIALWDSDDRLLTCNARFVEFHAAAAHLLTPGCLFSDFVRDSIMLGPPPDAEGREREWIAERLARHRGPGGRFLQQTSDGRWLRTMERRTKTGEIICVEADVTDDQMRAAEIAAARDAAETASHAKTRFLANVSHELRTPLNAVIGFSEMMRDQGREPESLDRYRDYAADINECGGNLLKMIDDILELTQIDSGTDKLDESRVDLESLIRECGDLVGRDAGKAGSQISVVLPDGLPDVLADRSKIAQCLVRLMNNAARYSEPDSEITVSAAVDGADGVRISVADSGRGMPVDDIARFMEPFGRASDPFVQDKPGLGLGLPLANLEIRQHGGRLEIVSRKGHGTTATICIPVERVLSGLDGDTTPAAG